MLNNGTNSIYNPIEYTVESNINLIDPSKLGYTFNGWYLDGEFTQKIETIVDRKGDITLYAKFTVNSYHLSLDAVDGKYAPKVEFISDGNIVGTEYLFSDGSINKYYPPEKEGYMFAGWYFDAGYENVFNFNTTINSDTTLYAKWLEKSCDNIKIETVDKPMNMSINGKTEQLLAFVPLTDATITITSNSNLDLIGILYNSNKTVLISDDDIDDNNLNFSFSYYVEAGELYYITVKGNTVSTIGNATISITWIGNCSIVGTTYTENILTYIYGSEYALPEYVEKEGYTFVGWFDDNNQQYFGGEWNYLTDIFLHAVFEKDI